MSVETTTSFKINLTFVTPNASVAVALTGTDCGVVYIVPAVGVDNATAGGVMSMLTVTGTATDVELFPTASKAVALHE